MGREPRRKGVGSERSDGGKRDSLGGGNLEKMSKILQHFIIFQNKYETKRRERLRKGWEAGVIKVREVEVQNPPVFLHKQQE